MSYGSNNSRNIANLLRSDPLDPIPIRNTSTRPLNPVNQSSLPRVQTQNQVPTQIPVEDVFTPDDVTEKRTRRRTPLSSGGNGDNIPPYRLTNREDDVQLEGIRVRLDQVVRYYDEKHSNL